jgi:hypothetical protein
VLPLSREAAPEFRAGAAASRCQRGGFGCAEVWTVDKPKARLGARRFAKELKGAFLRGGVWSFTISPVASQGPLTCLVAIRGPPILLGGFRVKSPVYL